MNASFDFGKSQQDPDSGKHSVLDNITRFLLPALSLVLLIVAELRGAPRSERWAIIGLTILFFGVSVYSPLRGWVRRRSERRKDARTARRAFPELKKFVMWFGDLVNPRTNDTLYYIVAHDVCRTNANDIAKFGFLDSRLWHDFWLYFVQRIERTRPNFSELTQALSEFYHLVNSYNNLCVMPIFERFPQELRVALTEEAKRALNSFQQRFARFLEDYGRFAKELSESRPALQGSPYGFSIPKPH